jgi:CRP/FNR family transcriptional regulator, cyclic AMP receptor protein
MGTGHEVEAWKIAQAHRDEWPRTSFLADLEIPVLRDFLSAGELIRFKKGDVLLAQGEAPAHAFLLLNACVKVTAHLDAGGEALLAVRMGGDVVGEVAVMDGGDRTATVRPCTHEEVTAISLDRESLRGLLSRYPDAGMSLTSAVGRKLRASTRRRMDITGCPAPVRMARAVLELAEDYGHPSASGVGTLIGVNLTQIELGTLIGVGETTAQRALRGLKKDGILKNSGRRLFIPDMDALRSASWSS